MSPLCPYCGQSDSKYEKTGQCGNLHRTNNWNSWRTKTAMTSTDYLPPVKSTEDELREAVERKTAEVNKRKAQEALTKVQELLKDVLTQEQLDSIVIVRKDDPIVGIPASVLFTIFSKHAELVEELRQIIDGLS